MVNWIENYKKIKSMSKEELIFFIENYKREMFIMEFKNAKIYAS